MVDGRSSRLSYPLCIVSTDEAFTVHTMTALDERVDVDDLITARRVARLVDIPPQSEGWLQARKLGIGGSDASAVCGLGEFKSAFEVYLDKTQTHPDGLTTPDNEPMRWGRLLEDPIADRTAELTGMSLLKAQWLYQHPDVDWMLGNVDRIAVDPARPDPGIYEGKTCSHWMAERWSDDEPATYALLQLMHYFGVLGLRWGIIAVLIGGQEFHYYLVERDDELVDTLVEYEADFWDRVLRRDPPPPTGMPSDSDLLNRLWSAVAEKQVIVGPEAVEIARRYESARLAEKAAKGEKDAAGNQLRLLIGDASEAVTEGGVTVATWKEHQTTEFEQKRFEAEMPLACSIYKNKRPQRTLRVKEV